MSKATQYELFGSDSEQEEDEEEPQVAAPEGDEAPTGVSDDGGGGDDDVGDLFGSDDDDGSEHGGAGALAHAGPSGEPLDIALPVHPRPAEDAKLYLVRLPNILSFQPRVFDAETYNEEEDAATRGEDGEESRRAANVIRWREGVSGERQSNARLVKWSDGSMTLHVGAEALSTQQITIPEGSTHLYSKHKDSFLECHGILRQKLTIAPTSRDSHTHQKLSRGIARQNVRSKRMQLVSTMQDPEAKKRDEERTYEEKRKLAHRQAQRRQRSEEMAMEGGPALTTAFLDADDDDDGGSAALDGNLGALKRGFKESRKRGPTGKPAGGAARRRPTAGTYSLGGKRPRMYKERRRGSDDDDEEDEEMEDSGEEEAEPGEMDGFLVGDEEGEEGESDEAEAEETGSDGDDSDDSERRPKKKKKRKGRLVDEDSD